MKMERRESLYKVKIEEAESRETSYLERLNNLQSLHPDLVETYDGAMRRGSWGGYNGMASQDLYYGRQSQQHQQPHFGRRSSYGGSSRNHYM